MSDNIPALEHAHQSEADKAGCPVCNPDKTVPQLNDAYRASNERVDPSVLWQWLHDLANKAGAHDALMLKAAADIVGAAKIVGVCEWTRLPDLMNPLELHRVQFKMGCNGQTARGVHPIYPDNCPHCYGRVKIASGTHETGAPTDWERARDVVAEVVRGLGGEARIGATLALDAISAAMIGKRATPETTRSPWIRTRDRRPTDEESMREFITVAYLDADGWQITDTIYKGSYWDPPYMKTPDFWTFSRFIAPDSPEKTRGDVP